MANSLFLDTKTYLSFYHLTSDDLNELNKLLLLINNGKIKLYLPEQTINEFVRNRDTKITDTIKGFDGKRLNNVFPQIIKDYEVEYMEIHDAIKKYETNKQLIIRKLKGDVNNKKLKADLIIEELFKSATKIDTTDSIITSAKKRFDLGNPPGNNKTYGDAINWESILSVVEEFDNFFFISEDKDYYSEFDNEIFNAFLLKEWNNINISTNFKCYKSLSRFLKDNYLNINNVDETKKEEIIHESSNFGFFDITDKELEELKGFPEFTGKQLYDNIDASIPNNERPGITEDEIQKMKDFLKDVDGKIKGSNQDIIEEYAKTMLMLSSLKVEHDDDLPF